MSEQQLTQGMSFDSKKLTMLVIKQYHIDNGYKFTVIESKSGYYICQCIDYNKGCQWLLQNSYSKRSFKWETRKIDTPHTCSSTNLSLNHMNLDSNQIASIVFHFVKTNPLIPIKSLIAEISNRFG